MTLGLIGCGKMGTALISGAFAKGAASPAQTLACDSYQPAAEALAKSYGAKASTIAEIATQADVVILCTKPNDAPAALKELSSIAQRSRLIISVAAGLTIDSIQDNLDSTSRVIRCMPNTPALVGSGAAAYATGPTATTEDAAFADALLSAVGQAHQVDEPLLDAVTGLSGSGPAYVYLMIEALTDGGVSNGIPPEQALQLATQTVLGAARMVSETGLPPSELKDAVSSPGGTTIAGLATLEEAGFRSALIDAVSSATKRSRELGKK